MNSDIQGKTSITYHLKKQIHLHFPLPLPVPNLIGDQIAKANADYKIDEK